MTGPDRDRLPTAVFLAVTVAMAAVSMDRSWLLSGVLVAPLLLWSWLRSGPSVPIRHLLPVTGGLALVSLASPRLVPTNQPLGTGRWLVPAIQLALVALVLFGLNRWKPRRLVPLVVLGSALLIVATIAATPDPGIDVALLHQDAGRVLAAGGNPYTDVSVMSNGTAETAPYPIDGYPYPPAALPVFAGSAMLFGDPRWFSGLLLVVTTLLLMAGQESERSIVTGTVFAAQAGTVLVVEAAWTETVTVALLGWAVLRWSRSPRWSAISLGVALVSKQYLVLLLPLALAPVLSGRRRWIVLGGALGLLPGLLPDPVAFVKAAVLFHFHVPATNVTGTLAGLVSAVGPHVVFPWWVGTGVAVLLAVWLAGRSRAAADLTLAAATILSFAFLLGSQAYPNYWWLVAGMVLAGVRSDASTR